MVRISATALLLWVLFLVPALCKGGLLEHACDCETEVGISCDHEQGCEDDPCSIVARPEGQDRRLAAEVELLAVVASFESSDPHVELRGLFERGAGSQPEGPPGRENLPYRASDRPLLI
ncbi:MAG: hypothetical protein DWQ01_07275 [Planctomycetota bacterium]|nr:MAG: hypothetical protein DWQ01_07275 [Planctomycetota bacterium]